MTIDRLTSDVDLYSHLRLDVYLHGRAVGRQAPPSSEKGNVAGRHTRQNANVLHLDGDERQRPRRWDSQDGGTVVPFEQSGTELTEDQGDYGRMAEEVPVTLEGGYGGGDPLLAQVARLYTRSGRSIGRVNSAMVGTLLNAVA